MKRKTNIILLIICAIVLIAICAILSFLMPDTTVQRFSLFASMVLGLGTLFISFTAMFIAFKEMRNNERDRKNRIEENAERFIQENAEEIEYIPLCLIAFAYDKHHKFNRQIYNKFNLLNLDTKKEVLKQLEYSLDIINNSDWIDSSLKFIVNYIKDNDLGEHLLYDGYKYYRRSIYYSAERYDSVVEFKLIFRDVFSYNPKIKKVNEKELLYEGLSFNDFLVKYLDCKKCEDIHYQMYKKYKPVEVLTDAFDLRSMNTDEKIVCDCMMELVDDLCAYHLYNDLKIDFYDESMMHVGDAEIVTFEDRYMKSLMFLYNLSTFISKNE